MKNTRTIILLSLMGFLCFVYAQLFVQPELVEGEYLVLKDTFDGHCGEVCAVKFAPNDTLMLSGGVDPNTKIWNSITGEILYSLPHEIGTPAVDFNPNGKIIATGAYDGKVRL